MVEEDQGSELRLLFVRGFRQRVPVGAGGAAFQLDAGILKDSPDETGAIVAFVVVSAGTIRDADSLEDGLMKQSFKVLEPRAGWCQVDPDESGASHGGPQRRESPVQKLEVRLRFCFPAGRGSR